MMAKAKRTKKATAKRRIRRGRGKGKHGRPIEATDEVLARVAEHVAEGNYIETACDLEGVSIHTARPLMRHGLAELRRMALDGDKNPAPELARAVHFALAIRQARAKAEKDDLDVLRTAAKGGQWQACAWRLERRQPDRWGRRERHEHSGPGGKPIPFAGVMLDPEKLKHFTDEELRVFERAVNRLGEGDDSGGVGTPQG